jgi:hypothetical protein
VTASSPPAITAAGLDLPTFTPHGLRHTAASLAIASGADIKIIQTMLGHKTAAMTLYIYGHLFPDRLDEVAAALAATVNEHSKTQRDSTSTSTNVRSSRLVVSRRRSKVGRCAARCADRLERALTVLRAVAARPRSLPTSDRVARWTC